MTETELKLALALDEIAKINIKFLMCEFGVTSRSLSNQKFLFVIEFDSENDVMCDIRDWLFKHGYAKQGLSGWLRLTKKSLDLILGSALFDNFIGVDEL